MIETKPMEFPGVNKFIENIDYYLEIFLRDGILVFRDANITYDDHELLQIRMADKFKWSPGPNRGKIHRYRENHAGLVDPQFGSEDLMLEWHMEHLYWNNPIIAGLWNMLKFDTDPENGKTYFYDTRKVYDMLSSDEQSFLSKCTVNVYNYLNEEMQSCKVIQNHWYSSQPVIRMPFYRLRENFHDLKFFGGEEPTGNINQNFLALANKIKDIVHNDLDNRVVHKWQKGDLVIPDLFVMAHAVTGGFDPSEREFTGLWSFEKDNILYSN